MSGLLYESPVHGVFIPIYSDVQVEEEPDASLFEDGITPEAQALFMASRIMILSADGHLSKLSEPVARELQSFVTTLQNIAGGIQAVKPRPSAISRTLRRIMDGGNFQWPPTERPARSAKRDRNGRLLDTVLLVGLGITSLCLLGMLLEQLTMFVM